MGLSTFLPKYFQTFHSIFGWTCYSSAVCLWMECIPIYIIVMNILRPNRLFAMWMISSNRIVCVCVLKVSINEQMIWLQLITLFFVYLLVIYQNISSTLFSNTCSHSCFWCCQRFLHFIHSFLYEFFLCLC